ncbi:MAG: DUF4251 domain-containing protein [Bacteroidales bacterium]|nr:DUF4251 domain-containing protein [Bacteroidales bacterium]
MILLGGIAHAQDGGKLSPREQRKLLKEEKQRIEKEEAARYAILVEEMVTSPAFVLEADMLYDRYGQSLQVQSTINFLMVDSTYGVIQVGSPLYLGQNGVGGVTLEGPVSRYEVDKNEKRGTYSISYGLRSTMGNYDVTISVSSSGRADARVSGNFSGSLRYSGRLVHPVKSRVFKGTSF